MLMQNVIVDAMTYFDIIVYFYVFQLEI